MSQSAVLMNDAARDLYSDSVVLPYFNMALDILQELFELNDIPVTHRASPSIIIKSGIKRVDFGTTPALPASLIEIYELWESPSGLNEWTPVTKKDFIPHYLEDNTTISQFLLWASNNAGIDLIAANADNDLKIDGLYKIFDTPIIGANTGVNLPFVNITTFMEFETAALLSFFCAENPTRGQELNVLALDALTRALGIPIKAQQTIFTRRRPFRSSFKRRNVSY